MKMAKPTSTRNLYTSYIFPSSPPPSSSRIQSKISINIKTLIHPITIPNIAKILLTLLPRAKALLLRFSKGANSRLRIPSPNSIKMLLEFLESIDIKAFVDGFVIPCLNKLTEFVVGRPRWRSYSVARRLRLSFSRKFKCRVKKSTSSSYFRFHHNWSSRSYIFPVPASVLSAHSSNSYRFLYLGKNTGDSVASSNIDEEGNVECHDSQLNGYLEWLDQRGGQGRDSPIRHSAGSVMSDVDMLAEKFIEEKYGMFILEKQESERMFQEMMARSL